MKKIKTFFFFKCAIKVTATCRTICRRKKKCPFNKTLSHNFHIKLKRTNIVRLKHFQTFSILSAQKIVVQNNSSMICRKTKMWRLSIIFLDKFVDRFTKRSMKRLFLQKNSETTGM